MIKPEKKVQVLEIEPWLHQRGFSFEIYDSKGEFSSKLGRYTKNKGMKKGTPDIMGCDPDGMAVYIELKEPKKGHICRLDQFMFLSKKIECGAFAVVVTSSQQLEEYYNEWKSLEPKERKRFLTSILPKKVLIDSKPPKIMDAPIL